MEQQITAERDHQEAITKLIDVEQRKIAQLQVKITRVQAGYEEGIYDAGEAKNRIKDYQKAIALAEKEILKLQRRAIALGIDGSSIDSLKRELELLRRTNLESACFDDKLRLMGLLNIKVYPSEDLKTVRIRTVLGINSSEVTAGSEQDCCGKVLFAPLECTE